MNEKRYLTRISYTKRAKIGYRQSIVIDGETVNISLNGILVSCFSAADIKPDETVHVSIFEGEYSVNAMLVDCIVTRNENNKIALQYKAVDYDTLMCLKRVVSDLYGNEDIIEDEFKQFIAGYSKKNGDK